LIKELAGMGLEVLGEGTLVHLANLMVQSELLARIKAAQLEVPECAKIKQLLAEGKANEFCLKEDGLHHRGTKMYHDVNGSYWWNNMKRDIAKFVKQCSTWQQVKVEHQRPAGTLKPLLIPK
jgi:hypothetical protein